MQAEEVTRVLRMLVQDDGQMLEERHGRRAVTIARDMAEALRYRLIEEAPFDTLWDDFVADPVGVRPQVTGALEALQEAYPGLDRRMSALMADYDRVINSSTAVPEPVADPPESTPETELTVEDTPDQFTQGTYLYGNVPGGAERKESEGREIGLKETDFGGPGRLERGVLGTTAIPGVFRKLYRAVEDHPDLTLEDSRSLDTRLHQIEALLDQNNLTSQESEQLTKHLDTVRSLSQDIYDLLIQELREGASELGEQAQEVIETR